MKDPEIITAECELCKATEECVLATMPHVEAYRAVVCFECAQVIADALEELKEEE